MDTSKKYIKMCEKVEEIQKLRPNPIEYTRGIDGINVVLYDYEGNLWFNRDGEDLLWLPRQDQLQEIYIGLDEDTLDRMFSMCESFTDKTYIDHWKPWHFFESMEQLWLAFVMKEKWNKVWDGKEWVKKG